MLAKNDELLCEKIVRSFVIEHYFRIYYCNDYIKQR